MSDGQSIVMRTSAGLKLCATAFGLPNDPLVLLLHGGGQTRQSWQRTGETLAANGYYAVCTDSRGHGDSDWDPDGNYRVDAFIDDLRQWIVHLGDRDPILVGASLGGFTSLLFEGESDSSRSRALVLVDVTPTVQPSGVKRIVDFMRARPDGFTSLREAADLIAAYLPHRKRRASLDGLAKNLRLREDGRYHWHWDMRFIVGKAAAATPKDGLGLQSRLINAAKQLTQPTLLVRGKLSDLVAREDVERFQGYAPHAEFVDISEAGHMVAGDCNDPFSEAVVQFLQRHRERIVAS